MTVTENGTTLCDVFFHKWNYMIHALVFNAVNKLNLGTATVHSEHPTNDDCTTLTVKLFMVDFAFVNFNRTCQNKKRENVFFDVMTVGFSEQFEVLV